MRSASSSSPAQILASVAHEYGGRVVDPLAVSLEKLRLTIRVRPSQVMEQPGRALFIAILEAATAADKPGAEITCVGMAATLEAAMGQAIGQWCLSVLPVLAHWRGGHSCLSTTGTLSGFDVLEGPVLSRQLPSTDEPTAPENIPRYETLLAEALTARRLKPRLHWIECYACRSADGSVDATCRLDNRDWTAGRQILVENLATWPPSDAMLDSRRGFLLLLPQGGKNDEFVVPSFWARLFGRA